MNADELHVPAAFIEHVHPIVLVGGKSRRFGRDKLREPWGDSGMVLVQRPIESLRTVFGQRIKLVGECDSSIPALADGMIPDLHPGLGPIGGILSALRACEGSVFVLAGDMPGIRPANVLRLLAAAVRSEDAWAVLARTDRVHPCAGLYRPTCIDALANALASDRRRLTEAIPQKHVVTCQIDEAAVRNVNTPDDAERYF